MSFFKHSTSLGSLFTGALPDQQVQSVDCVVQWYSYCSKIDICGKVGEVFITGTNYYYYSIKCTPLVVSRKQQQPHVQTNVKARS